MSTLTTLLSYDYKAKRAADPVYTVVGVLLRSKSWSPGDLGMKMLSEGLG